MKVLQLVQLYDRLFQLSITLLLKQRR